MKNDPRFEFKGTMPGSDYSLVTGQDGNFRTSAHELIAVIPPLDTEIKIIISYEDGDLCLTIRAVDP